jgi:hypothetical protein
MPRKLIDLTDLTFGLLIVIGHGGYGRSTNGDRFSWCFAAYPLAVRWHLGGRVDHGRVEAVVA